ncbi:MAG: DUF1801 domain-containing protein [Candidatus Dormibacteria bacterium]|jgi:uncharacterized protein YdhG (YjbR/CyaY superfamily)
MKTKKTPATSAAKPAAKRYDGFTAEEKAAMKDRVKELKRDAQKADGDSEVVATIAGMPEEDRVIAERLHTLIKGVAPELVPRTWYGMPAYSKDDKVVCFFQGAYKFKARYATLGFSDQAHLDEGSMWPSTFALTKLTAADETRIKALVKKALS